MGFLERINEQESGDDRASGDESVDDLLESIRDNLQRVFSSRHGMSVSRIDDKTNSRLSYGLPEITNIYAGDRGAKERLRTDIQAAVENFEPRLRRPRALVKTDDEGGKLRTIVVQITATILLNGKDHGVRYDVPLTRDGQFHVQA
jgi:type VI secretion system lysozyme-like protein